MGQRAGLVEAGWGIAPLYVGEQVIPPGSQRPSALKGKNDGEDAVNLLITEGFDPGTCVFLDLEDGSLPSQLAEYTAAWIDAVAEGGFQPGVYCSHSIAAQVDRLRPGTPIWAFKVPTTDHHEVAGPPFREDDPSGSGFAAARAWQLDQNGSVHVSPAPGGRLTPIDLSSALSRDPGAPAATA
jgi:hypothetical protein